MAGMPTRIRAAAALVRLDSRRFCTGVCTCTGGGERRPMAAAVTNRAAMNRAYSHSADQPAADTLPPPTSAVRSVFFAACQKITSARRPDTAAVSFRHHGSRGGCHAVDPSAIGGSGA